MTQSSSSSSRGIWLSLIIILIQVIAILIFVPSTWLVDVIRIEDQMLYETLGEKTATRVEEIGYGLYSAVFIQTGIADFVHSLFIPTEAERARTRGLETLGEGNWFPWLEGRGLALKLVLIQACERIAHIWTWAPIMLLILVPAMLDGYMNWQMKRTSMGYSSPFWHRLGVRTIGISVLLMVVTTFLPMPVPPILLPVVVMVVIPLVGSLVVANLPKRI